MTAADTATPRAPVVVGDDGLPRCSWGASDAEYRRYHDEEWGTPLHGDRPLFEKLTLEAFQSGLSWITILRRRPAFRAAFDGFDIRVVAGLGDSDVERLLLDAGIIRNRAKILATIANARIALGLVADDPGAFDRLMWSHAPTASRPRPTVWSEILAITPESAALSGTLRALGFRFVGPTTMHALMQSTGMVDDHFAGCWRAR
jgi:DNA-3-methyladenine glycosylase I